MRSALRCIAVVGLGTALGASLGMAQAPLRVRYTAFEGCPSETEFTREVTRRIHVEGRDEKEFLVVLERRGPRVVGRLSTGDRAGRQALRELTGDTCAEVASALVLVVALAIDPRASTAPTSSVSPTAPSVTPAAPPAASPPPSAPVPVASAYIPPAPFPIAAPAVRATPWAVGVAALMITPVAPSGALGGGGFVEVASGKEGAAARLWGITAGRNQEVPTGGGARFRYLAARLEGTPLRLRPAPSLTLAPSLGVDLGAIRAEGVGLPETHAQTRFFAAALVIGRLRWEIATPLFAEIAAGGMLPLVRDDFVIDRPRTTVQTPGRLGATVDLAVSVRIW